MEIGFQKLQEERLPTLYEVLIQKTDAPVDLWSFYTFLSQFPYAINYLEFWIDLMAHIRLCKDYIRGIRESVIVTNENFNEESEGYNVKQNKEEEMGDDNASVTSSVLINALMDEGYLDFQDPDRVKQFLQGNVKYSPHLSQLVEEWKRHSGIANTNNAQEVYGSDNKVISAVDELLKTHTKGVDKPRITTKQLYNNALQICSLYLLSPERSAKYLINIPDDIRQRTIDLIEKDKRHDPEVFEDMKNLAYQFLEIDCFTKFLSRVALHNIHDQISDWRFHSSLTLNTGESSPVMVNIRHHSRSPFSSYTTFSRISFGMLSMGIGFWLGFVLIFLNYHRGIRVVTIVPFLIGSYFIVCGIYQLDIVYSVFGVTQELMFKHKTRNDAEDPNYELTPRAHIPGIFRLLGGSARLSKIQHGFIRNMLFKRGMWCLFWVILQAGLFTIIFSCVPGHRL